MPLQRGSPQWLLEALMAAGSQANVIRGDEDAALGRVMAGRASPCSGEGAIIALGKDSVGAVGHLETITRSVEAGKLACPPPGTDHPETVGLCGLAAVGFPVTAGGAPRGPSPVLDKGLTDRKIGRDRRLSASRTYPQLASLCTEGGVYMGNPLRAAASAEEAGRRVGLAGRGGAAPGAPYAPPRARGSRPTAPWRWRMRRRPPAGGAPAPSGPREPGRVGVGRACGWFS